MAICLRRFSKILSTLPFNSTHKHSTFVEKRTTNAALPSLNEPSFDVRSLNQSSCTRNTSIIVSKLNQSPGEEWVRHFQESKNVKEIDFDNKLATTSELLQSKFLYSQEFKIQNDDSKQHLEGRPTEEQLQKIHAKLAHDLPRIFVNVLDYQIYHPDIVFENNIKGYTTVGRINYVKQVGLLKIVANLKYSSAVFLILKMTSHPEDSSIKVRWQIRGMPGLARFWKMHLKWGSSDEAMKKGESWYDGFSTFYVGRDGTVHKHVVDKVMPDTDSLTSKISKTILGGKVALFVSVQSPSDWI